MKSKCRMCIQSSLFRNNFLIIEIVVKGTMGKVTYFFVEQVSGPWELGRKKGIVLSGGQCPVTEDGNTGDAWKHVLEADEVAGCHRSRRGSCTSFNSSSRTRRRGARRPNNARSCWNSRRGITFL